MSGMPDPYVLAFLLAVGLAVLLMYSRLLAAIQGAAPCCRGYHGAVEMLGNTYVVDSVRIVFMLLIPFYALALVLCRVSAVGYLWTLVALVGLWLFRKLVFLLLGWLTSRAAGFRALERVGYALGVLMMLCAMPAVLLAWLVPATPEWLLKGWLAVLAVVAFLLYFRRGLSMISQTGFSVFFWVLYLCGLELLPICVVVNLLLNGN